MNPPSANDEVRTIVIDNGTGYMKAGFAGEKAPTFVFPSVVGRLIPKGEIVTGKMGPYIGEEAVKHRAHLTLKYPLEHGIITDWDSLERLWEHLFNLEMRIAPEEYPIILTEETMGPKASREKMAEIMFERFSAPALHVALSSILTLYVSGRTQGIVLDCGDGVTYVTPIIDGYSLPHAIARLDLAGRDLTDYLMTLLRESGSPVATGIDREIARDIKEKMCFVGLDFAQWPIEPRNGAKSYELPDGKILTIENQRFRCPEALFQPSFVGKEDAGVHVLLHNSMMKCDADICPEFYNNIIVSGGSTLFRGFPERLEKEIVALAPPKYKVRVVAPPERRYSPWIGGSILGSLSTFQGMWVSKEEYDESGSAVIHRRCF